MEQEFFTIRGGNALNGRVALHGAKNAVLPLLAAAVMTARDVSVCDCPYISDVENMKEVLRALGLRVVSEGRRITVSGEPCLTDIPPQLSRVMRSSMFMLGALLTTTGEVRLATPGGCRIGARPLDIHLDGLQRLGATVEIGNDYVHCFARRLKGADIVMKYPSVGATENLLMSAVRATGTTTLIGCAREPEIVSLAQCLRTMGARIRGEGTSVMVVEGVEELGGTTFLPIEDRIVCGTMIYAAALNGGVVEIENARPENICSVAEVMDKKHCKITDNGGSVTVKSDGKISPVGISTGPYPLFPTDMQAQLMACLCGCDGVGQIRETVFENRFAHVAEFAKMGAVVSVENRTAVVKGGKLRASGELYASDLRGGAGIVIAALKAEGTSVLRGVEYIDRGYESIEKVLSSLGAEISRNSELKNIDGAN